MYADHSAIAIGSYQQPRRAVAVRPVRLAPRPAYLAGREELVAEIRTRLTSRGMLPRLIALHGLGGVGKTSLALEYAHRYQREYGLIWQIAAEDPATMSANYRELATLLGVRDLVDTANPVRQVHAALAARTDRWLLLLDNVTDAPAVANALPPAASGHVLITTRSAHWPTAQALEVPVLDLGVAAGFLLNRTGDDDTAAAAEVAEELGTLPLALGQAAAYLQATGRSLGEYLALLRERRAELLAHGQPSGYDKQVATTWALAFEQLDRTEPGAIALLRLLACYAPETIPIHRLLSPREASPPFDDDQVGAALLPLLTDPFAVDAAVTALRRYSLISPPSQGAVSMHRLVQAVTLDQLAGDQAGAWRRAAALLLNAALPDDPHRRGNWPAYGGLLPHARVTLTPESASMRTIVSYLGASGDYATAKTLQQQIHDSALSRLGPEHPDTIIMRSQLAYWTGQAGNAAAARDQFTALLPVSERVLGPEHLDTLNTRCNVARWTGEAGDPTSARDQFAVLLPISERVLGPEHPDTLIVQSQLAYWTGLAGYAAAARDHFTALLPIRERVSGPGHPDTLSTWSNVAYWTGESGNVTAARDQFAKLLPIRERILGPEHPDTLNTRSNLARWTGDAGDATAARDQYAALVPIRERILGPEHPATLIARSSLAYWTGKAGDPTSARDQYATLLPISERVSGPEHPDTLNTRNNLARWIGNAGDPTTARDQYAALVPVSERVLGPEHPGTLTTRASLAYWTGQAGDPATARDQFNDLLPIRERVSGAEHPDTVNTRSNLAWWSRMARRPAS